MTERQRQTFSVPIGGIPVIGSDALSAQALDFIEIALQTLKHRVRSIYIDTNNTLETVPNGKHELEKVTGWHDFRTRTVEINLRELFNHSVEGTSGESSSRWCSIRCDLWFRFCSVVLHEIGHDNVLEEKGVEAYNAEDEDELMNWATKQAMDLGMTYSMEPALMEHEPFFGKLLSEELEKAASEKGREDWLIFQIELMDAGLMYRDDEKEIEVSTYHEFQRRLGTDPDNKAWGENTIQITPVKPEEPVSVVPLPDKPIVAAPQAEVAQPYVVQPQAQPQQPLTQIVDQTMLVTTILDGNEQGEVEWEYPEDEDESGMAQVMVNNPDGQKPAPATKKQFKATPITQGQPLQPEITKEIWLQSVYAIYLKAYDHIFSAGWQPNSDNPFTNPGYVVENAFSVADIPYGEQIVTAMDCTMPNGQQAMNTPVTSFVRGKLAKSGMPCVVMYLNRFGGGIIKRTIIAINPKGTSTSSQMARTKRCAFIFDNNKDDSEHFNVKCPLWAIENATGQGQLHKQ